MNNKKKKEKIVRLNLKIGRQQWTEGWRRSLEKERRQKDMIALVADRLPLPPAAAAAADRLSREIQLSFRPLDH